MTEILEIDGITLRGQGFGCATRTGRYSFPARRGDNTVLPGSSGSQFAPNKPYEEGVGALSLWAIGANTDLSGNLTIPSTMALQRAAFEENMNKIMRLFSRGHKLSLIRAAQPDGTIRRAYVEWKEWSEPEVQAGGTRAEWAISYVIPTTWWEEETVTSQNTGAGASLPKTMDLTQFSGMTGIIEDAVLTVVGPITTPRITDLETGAYVQYGGTLSGSQTWVVDVGAVTSKVNGTSVMANTTHVGGYKLLSIPNCFGTLDRPSLRLSGGSGSTTTNFTVAARKKWATG